MENENPTPPDAPTMADIDRLVSPRAKEQLREAIRTYKGDEVFFVGTLDENSIVIDVEPCAYGNESAVPVIEQMLSPGAVVLHNHPGGDLRPSQADIEVASRIGNMGVGSYIIDNAVAEIRVIVPAMRQRQRQPLDVEQLESLLSPEGPLARSMPGYESRPQQIEMLRAVANAFNSDGIAAIEAGTGTGKSLAYLVPAIHWARANAEKVMISTNTINLQEQLIVKDLPFLARHLGLEFKAELMKGRSNYLCRRKAGYLRLTPDFFGDDQSSTQIEALLDWAGHTKEGSLSGLSFVPDGEAWEQVSCDADNCSRARCGHYAKCFFFQARRRAASADLIVVNHHLLMSDLAVRLETNNYTSTAVLPPYKRIVLDEAHNIEEVATQYFGIRVTRRVVTRLLARLVHRERSSHGLLPFIHNHLILDTHRYPSEEINQALTLISETLIPLRLTIAESVDRLMDLCAESVSRHLRQRIEPKKELKLRITPDVESTPFWYNDLRQAVDVVAREMSQLASGLNKVRTILSRLPEEPREELETPAGEIRSLANRLTSKANEFKNFHTVGENQCRWIEVYLSGGRVRVPAVRLISLPLEVQGHLNKAVYGAAKTVVLTSATLSVNRKFDFFLGQVGLSPEQCAPDVLRRVNTLQLDTPFDYERQAFVGVPIDMPEPNDQNFSQAAIDFLLPVLQVSHGSAFILFTSYNQLNEFHGRLAPMLTPMGYTCLRQGTENRQTLLKRFKNDRTSILFATSSFWEGVDVPGDALKLLVLAKLPFRVPTDPLLQARVERLDAMGIDSFREYSVPQAVIRFKQGFGRLIRTREDRGAVLVLDKRVATKSYGRVFLNSLPADTIHRRPGLELLDGLSRFFS